MKILVPTLTALPLDVTVFTAGCATGSSAAERIRDRMAAHSEQYRRVEVLPVLFTGSAVTDASLTTNDLKALNQGWQGQTTRAGGLPARQIGATWAPFGADKSPSIPWGKLPHGTGKLPVRPDSNGIVRLRRWNMVALTLVRPPCPDNLAHHPRHPELDAQVP